MLELAPPKIPNTEAKVFFLSIFLFQKIHPSDGRRYNDSELCEILGVQSVQLLRKPSAEIGGAFAVKQTEIDGELCQRCRRFEVPVASEICSRCREVLDEFK